MGLNEASWKDESYGWRGRVTTLVFFYDPMLLFIYFPDEEVLFIALNKAVEFY